MKDIDKIILKVKSLFSDGCPNGTLLGWDVDRFYEKLAELCSGYKVTNDTDFNYSYCNSYDIKIKSESDDFIYAITLKASFVAEAFSLHVTKYSNNLRHGKIIPICEAPIIINLFNKIKEFIEGEGFLEIESEWMDVIVDGVDLELAEQATLGKVLFDDFE